MSNILEFEIFEFGAWRTSRTYYNKEALLHVYEKADGNPIKINNQIYICCPGQGYKTLSTLTSFELELYQIDPRLIILKETVDIN